MEQEQSREMTTKEKILAVAIELFAQNSFAAVSMRDIATVVGIKASSLYKHYESKEAILDHIFNLYIEKMAQTVLPREDLGAGGDFLTPEVFLKESFEKFKGAMWNPEVVKMTKIITREQQRNQSIRQFFVQELIEKPNMVLQYALDQMVEKNLIDPIDTRVLAEEYNAYLVYLYFEQNFLKESLNLAEVDQKMQQHNEFYARHILIKKGGIRE